MEPDRKARSNSILDSDQLTAAQREELRDMLLAGSSHSVCKAWLLQTCGVEIKGKSTLTRFWRRHCLPLQKANRQLAAVKAEGIIEDAGRTDWNAGTLELVKQVSFEMMSGQVTDPKTAEKFIKLILKADAQDTAREKLKATAKTKIEDGLEALFAEIKGNKKAEAIFKQLQEVVAKA